jgi:RNA recognition motif-containing protein
MITITSFKTSLFRIKHYSSIVRLHLSATTNKNSVAQPDDPEEKKDVFLNTRVFVQGIPKDVDWPEFKDHFKKSGGNVVYASISIDKITKESKGCGIVQYETIDEANNAIQIMGNFPLRNTKLFVRRDVQEKRNSGKFTSVWKLGLRKTPRSPDDKERSLSEVNEAKKPSAPRKNQPRKDGMIKNSDGTLSLPPPPVDIITNVVDSSVRTDVTTAVGSTTTQPSIINEKEMKKTIIKTSPPRVNKNKTTTAAAAAAASTPSETDTTTTSSRSRSASVAITPSTTTSSSNGDEISEIKVKTKRIKVPITATDTTVTATTTTTAITTSKKEPKIVNKIAATNKNNADGVSGAGKKKPKDTNNIDAAQNLADQIM